MTLAHTTNAPLHARRGTLRRSLRLSTLEGVLAELVTAFAGSGVLTAWALHLRCSPILVALLAALPALLQLVHLPSAWLTQARGSRPVAILAVGASRLALLPLLAFPFLGLTLESKRLLFLGITVLYALLGIIANNAWTAWMGDLVPAPVRGRYFGQRTSLGVLAGGVAGLAVGLALDSARKHGQEPQVLALLALVGTLVGVASLVLMARQAPPAGVSRRAVCAVCAVSPFRDRRLRPLLTYQVVWGAAVGVSASFGVVYMLQDLRMGFGLIAGYGAAVALVRVLAMRRWGKVIQRVGARSVLVVCSFGLIFLPLLWLVPPSDFTLWLLGIDVLMAGILWGGHGLASFELPLSLAPAKRRPFYVAAFHKAGGLAFALASLAGGWLATQVPSRLFIHGEAFHGLQLLFLLSALGRLFAAPLALRGRRCQEGAVPAACFA
ncbi:MFS transporter [Corallococcus sp. M34]|uniref:MFS transporter n=1 Tax=Citreicoccus inhibens TaxID=2849499 RepID=UPI00131536DD|nr:MFS transporter [Citreicoccus inhibens]MBU8894168.1 MFS transporter [Citreicoccus inhibens]